jgi:hypothetical protein
MLRQPGHAGFERYQLRLGVTLAELPSLSGKPL